MILEWSDSGVLRSRWPYPGESGETSLVRSVCVSPSDAGESVDFGNRKTQIQVPILLLPG